MKRHQQHASRETLAFLADHCEGNLLAARQEIDKLALLLPPGALAHDAVEQAIADVARYDVFQLSESWLAGRRAARCCVFSSVLQAEGDAPIAGDLATRRRRACHRRGPYDGAGRDAGVVRDTQRARLGQAAKPRWNAR